MQMISTRSQRVFPNSSHLTPLQTTTSDCLQSQLNSDMQPRACARRSNTLGAATRRLLSRRFNRRELRWSRLARLSPNLLNEREKAKLKPVMCHEDHRP